MPFWDTLKDVAVRAGGVLSDAAPYAGAILSPFSAAHGYGAKRAYDYLQGEDPPDNKNFDAAFAELERLQPELGPQAQSYLRQTGQPLSSGYRGSSQYRHLMSEVDRQMSRYGRQAGAARAATGVYGGRVIVGPGRRGKTHRDEVTARMRLAADASARQQHVGERQGYLENLRKGASMEWAQNMEAFRRKYVITGMKLGLSRQQAEEAAAKRMERLGMWGAGLGLVGAIVGGVIGGPPGAAAGGAVGSAAPDIGQ